MTEINFVSVNWNDSNVEAYQSILDSSQNGKYQYIYQQQDGGEFEYLMSTDELTQEEVEEIAEYDFNDELKEEVITLSSGKEIKY
jgi:hypothetical protein